MGHELRPLVVRFNKSGATGWYAGISRSEERALLQGLSDHPEVEVLQSAEARAVVRRILERQEKLIRAEEGPGWVGPAEGVGLP